MKSKEIAEVVTIGPEATIEAAAQLLSKHGIGTVVVSSDQTTPLGILSERDIVRRLADTPGKTLPQTVEELMSTDVITATPNQSVVEVLRLMTDGRFRHMPVLEQEQLVGMITIGDVVNFRLTALEYEALQLKQLIVG
eukprot:m.267565 g.267565  ORF g.267565 m.267565 type:complete len:138 (+) comp105917_c0_seq1:1-414(+)